MTRKRHRGLDMSGRDRSSTGRETLIRPHFSEDRNLVWVLPGNQQSPWEGTGQSAHWPTSLSFSFKYTWTGSLRRLEELGMSGDRHRDFTRGCLWKVRGLGLGPMLTYILSSYRILRHHLNRVGTRKWAITEEWEICMDQGKATRGRLVKSLPRMVGALGNIQPCADLPFCRAPSNG